MTAVSAAPLAAPALKTGAPSATPDEETKLLDTARRFEAAFLAPMVSEMLRTAGPASLGAGHAEEMWRSIHAGAIAEEIARTGTTGIAQSLQRQLKAYGG